MSISNVGRWLVGALVGMAIAVSVAPVAAQEIAPEQLALARKYVDLTTKSSPYEVILYKAAQQTSTLLTQQNPDIATKINMAIGKIVDSYAGKRDDLYNQFARVYAQAFTPDELQQIVAFYQTPAGQKLADSGIDNNQAIQKVMQIYTYNFGTEFVTKVKAELKAEGITP